MRVLVLVSTTALTLAAYGGAAFAEPPVVNPNAKAHVAGKKIAKPATTGVTMNGAKPSGGGGPDGVRRDDDGSGDGGGGGDDGGRENRNRPGDPGENGNRPSGGGDGGGGEGGDGGGDGGGGRGSQLSAKGAMTSTQGRQGLNSSKLKNGKELGKQQLDKGDVASPH